MTADLLAQLLAQLTQPPPAPGDPLCGCGWAGVGAHCMVCHQDWPGGVPPASQRHDHLDPPAWAEGDPPLPRATTSTTKQEGAH